MPEPNEVRVSKDGREAVWTGSQWMILPSNPSTGTPSGRTDAEDFSTFKNAATSLGSLASLFLPEVGIPARVAAAVLGGAAARGTASAMVGGGNVPADLAKGAMAGGIQEALPLVAGPAWKYGGAGLQKLASLFGVGSSPTSAAIGAGTRALIAHDLGFGPGGTAAAVVGPPIARGVGKGMQTAGEAISGRTTSQNILKGLQFLTGGGEDAATAAAPAMAPRLVKQGAPKVESVLDDALQGLRNESSAPIGDTPSVRSVDRGNISAPGGVRSSPPVLDPGAQAIRDQTATSVPAAMRSGAPAQTGSAPVRQPSEAELFNLNRSAPYGEGATIPQALPTELRPLSLQGLEEAGQIQNVKPYDVDYMSLTGQKYMPDMEVVPPDESGLFNEAPSNHVVADLVEKLKARMGDVPTAKAASPELPSSWQQFSSGETGTRASAPEIDLPPSLKAIDEMFGPGATDMEGAPLQSTGGYKGANNLLYDPQTPTSYLRDQLSTASDPADRDFLARALRQRMRVGTSKLNLTGGQP